MKPERYKVKDISEVAENSAIISGLKQGQDMKEYNLIGATKQEIIEKIQNGFSTKERELYVLAKTSIFGSEKRLILSSDTIQSHHHHSDITTDDYVSLVNILNSKTHNFSDKKDKRILIILAHYGGKNYRLIIKNIPSKDEVFIQSLSNIGHRFAEIKRVIKKAKNKG